MTNPKHTDTSRSGDLVGDDFAPIWDESILLAEHEAVQASVDVGGWLSAALDDPNVCDAMKTDINRWFSAGFLYLDEVRKLMQTERESLEAENERLRKLTCATWFYMPDEGDRCWFSPHEVIDEMYDPEPGNHVFEVECATSLPSIWCAVRVTDDPDADERFTFTEHATEAEARAALGEK